MSKRFSKTKWAVIAANLILIALLINMISIPLLGPADGLETTERRPEFSWGGLSGTGMFTFLLDEDPAFGSPVVEMVAGNFYQPETSLDFGTYYWKVISPEGISSATGTLTVVSEVAVERGNGWLKNAGNTDIFLERRIPERETDSLNQSDKAVQPVTGMVVGIGQTIDVGGNENVTASQV